MFLKILENLIIAKNNFRDNFVRSLISMMGVTVSVASVICIVSVGIGAEAAISSKINGLGPNLITVLPGGGDSQAIRLTGLVKSNLTMDDAKVIEKECPSVRFAVPVLSDSVTCKYKKSEYRTSISGTTPDYYVVRNWFVDIGKPFDIQDYNSQRSVCLLGRTVVKKLFGREDPIGKIIKVDTANFKVIGILQEKGMIIIQDMDDTIFVPLSSMQKKLSMGKTKNVTNILVQPNDSDSMNSAKNEIVDLLRKRNNLKKDKENNFTVGSQTEIFSLLSVISRILTLMLGGISSISILVGGIGIMNIMLVSVTERTREIGTRKAMGATPSIIRQQFLFEAIYIGQLGGILGIILGIVIGNLIALLIGGPFVVPWLWVMGGVLLCFIVSIASGYIPANKAAKLDPIDALRYE
ncbi:MAG: ABC transporter permease [Candidatus Eremiobacterota bacterium]